MNFLKTLQTAHQQNKKLIAVLVDPDKISIEEVKSTCDRINKAPVDFLLLGGSTVDKNQTEIIAKEIKNHCTKPVVLFPGDYTHLTNYADAVLLLNLISGNNPEYLIHQQIKAVPFLKKSNLEIISTGYILIDGGTETSTMRVSNTKPLIQKDTNTITNTALAGQYMGQELLYLEAGSGAEISVNTDIIKKTSSQVNIPVIVGGGIKTLKTIKESHQAGATLVVIGTAFENKDLFDF